MTTFIKRHPMLTYALVGLILLVVGEALGAAYDASGLRGAIWWLGAAFRIPFWVVGEAIFTVNQGAAIPWQEMVCVVGGLAICIGLDAALNRIRG